MSGKTQGSRIPGPSRGVGGRWGLVYAAHSTEGESASPSEGVLERASGQGAEPTPSGQWAGGRAGSAWQRGGGRGVAVQEPEGQVCPGPAFSWPLALREVTGGGGDSLLSWGRPQSPGLGRGMPQGQLAAKTKVWLSWHLLAASHRFLLGCQPRSEVLLALLLWVLLASWGLCPGMLPEREAGQQAGTRRGGKGFPPWLGRQLGPSWALLTWGGWGRPPAGEFQE